MLTRRVGITCAAVLMAAAAWLIVGLGGLEPGGLRGRLAWWSPLACELAVVLMFVGAIGARRSLAKLLPPKALGVSFVVGVIAFIVVSWLPPRTHRIYYDEDIYQNVAQNILFEGKAQMCNEGVLAHGWFDCWAGEYNKEPNAYPFLLSLAYRFTGVDEWVAHAMNRVHLGLAVASICLLAFLHWQSLLAALTASLIFAGLPVNLLWSATAAVEPGAAAWSIVAVLGACVFLRETNTWTLLLGVGATVFAAQWRPESIMIFGVVSAVVVLERPGARRKELLIFAALSLFLLIPHLLHLWAVRAEGWGADDGAKFAWRYVVPNARANLRYLVEGREMPRLVILLALVGTAMHWNRPRRLVLPLVWFALFFGIFLAFHAGSYRYGADIRFALVSHAPVALAAGAGALWVSRLLSRRLSAPVSALVPVLALLHSMSGYLPLVRTLGAEAHEARADHMAAEAMLHQLPDASIVLSHNPGMWHVLGASSLQSSYATYQPSLVDGLFRRFSGGVYFHYNFWCEAGDEAQEAFCSRILESYETRVVHEQPSGFKRFILYRVLPNVALPPPMGLTPSPPGDP